MLLILQLLFMRDQGAKKKSQSSPHPPPAFAGAGSSGTFSRTREKGDIKHSFALAPKAEGPQCGPSFKQTQLTQFSNNGLRGKRSSRIAAL